MQKTDLTKLYKPYYTAKNEPAVIEIEEAAFVSITGQGNPSGSDFAASLEALYPVAYAIKFGQKAQGKDFAVAKLEGLWWFDEKKYKGVGMNEAPQQIPRSEWYYRMMIRMPDFVTAGDVKEAAALVADKKKLALAKSVEFFTLKEGKCVQMLHVGSFGREPETLAVMEEYMGKQGFKRNGLHHEIYLSDFRKTPEDKLKTILREPVK